MSVTLFGDALFLFLAVNAVEPFWIVFWMTCFGGVSGLGASGVQAFPIDLAPPGQEGGFSAFYAFLGGLGNFFAPMIMGFIIDSRFGYDGGFVVTAVVAVVGAILFDLGRYDKHLELRPQDLASIGEAAS
jgi:MFS-type transporter involved in bile tolerance (Atg22 family)